MTPIADTTTQEESIFTSQNAAVSQQSESIALNTRLVAKR